MTMPRTKGAKDTKPRKRSAQQRAQDQAEADVAKSNGGNGVSSTAVKEAMAVLEKAERTIICLNAQWKREIAPFREDQKRAKHRAKQRGVPMQAFNLVWKQRKLELDLEPSVVELAQFVRDSLTHLAGTPLGDAAEQRAAEEPEGDIRPGFLKERTGEYVKENVTRLRAGIKKLPPETQQAAE